MARRSRAREVVLQLLYRDDLNPGVNVTGDVEFLRGRLNDDELFEFAAELLNGVRRNQDELNVLLDERAVNWTVRRMAVIDRNVLRLGAYEIMYGGTPGAVAIDEAVELAKRYGGKQSAVFVNGVLDRFIVREESPADPGDAPA